MASPWNTRDKQWMKQRRRDWTLTKKFLDRASLTSVFNWLKKSEQTKILKEYYLYGRKNNEYPIANFTDGIFLRIWLHPDHSEERWERIRKESTRDEWLGAERIVREYIMRFSSERSEWFFGEEVKLFELFYKKGFRRSYFDDLENSEWLKVVQYEFNAMCRNLHCCLSWPVGNPVYGSILQFDRWSDSFDEGYKDSAEYVWLVDEMNRVLNNKENYKGYIVSLAEKIREKIYSGNSNADSIVRANEIMNMSRDSVYAITSEGNPEKVKLMSLIRLHLVTENV